MTTQVHKTRGLRIATRCTSIDQFVDAFHRFCDEHTVFISTLAQRPVGLETAFSIDLADGTPAVRGLGVVLHAWSGPDNPFGRPGMQLGLRRLTADSERVRDRLVAARAAAKAAPVAARPAAPPPIATPPPIPARARVAPPPAAAPIAPPSPTAPPAPATPEAAAPPAEETRTPGSELVLPANPLMGINDQSLEGFVECSIYEETGNFFPAEPSALDEPGEPPADPPLLAPLARAPTPDPTAAPPPRAATSDDEPARIVAAVPVEPPPPPVFAPAPVPVEPPPPPVFAPAPVPVEPPPPPVFAPAPPPLDARPRRWRLDPRWRPDPRWLIAGGGALVVILIVVLVATARGHGSAAARPAAPPAAPKPTELAMRAPPPPPAPAPAPAPAPVADPVPAAPAADPKPAADDPQTAGMPVVGTGPCRVTIETTPAGSSVQLDGHDVGPSPLIVDGPCERRRLTVAHPRYAPATRWLAPAAGKPESVEVTLQRPTHTLLVLTIPPGATISIDGRTAGRSPTTVRLMGFTTIPVRVSKPGYAPVTKRIYSKNANDRMFVRLSRR